MQAQQAQTEFGSPTRRVALSSWGWTHQGNFRDENQDAFLNWPEERIWAVADGVGGSDHGRAASHYIIQALMRRNGTVSLDESIAKTRRILEDSNEFLFNFCSVAGTAVSTVVVLLMHEGEAACLWAGDSRCYLFRDNVLYQCTHDHTLRQHKIDKGELTVPEANRMIRDNIITSAVGAQQPMKLDEVRFSLRAGDRFLLCSDGLNKLLEASSLSSHLKKPTPRESVDSIVEAIKYLPQPDNITFVTTFLSRGGLP